VESFTGALLDSSTFVVCDEAHMLEPRVRDLVSDGVADASLADAERELTRVIQPLRLAEGESRGNEDARRVRAVLEESGVSLSELEDTRTFLRELREELDRRVTAYLEREHRGWRASMTDLEDDEIPLRDPEEPAPDAVSRWARDAGFDERVWLRAETVGVVVAGALDEIEDEEKQRVAPGVGRALGAWHRAGHEDYFRERGLVAPVLQRAAVDAQLHAWRRHRRATRRVRRRRADVGDAGADGRVPRGDRPRPPRRRRPAGRDPDLRADVPRGQPRELRGRGAEVHLREPR
jgi:hypothetical protein